MLHCSQYRMGSDWHSRVRLPDAATSSKMQDLRFPFDLSQDTSEFSAHRERIHRNLYLPGRTEMARSFSQYQES